MQGKARQPRKRVQKAGHDGVQPRRQHGVQEREGKGLAVSADVVQRKHGDKEKYVKENGGKIELFAFVHSSLRWLIGLSEITITKTRPRNLADFASFWLSRAKPRPRRQKRRGAKNASCRFAASQGIGLLRGRCGRMGGR